MSGQLLELLIFAGVAIFLVSKLINLLGSTSEDDPAMRPNSNSFYGEKATSGLGKTSKKIVGVFSEALPKKSIVKENKKDILKGLKEVTQKIPNFSIDNFLKGARAAFKMIIEAGVNENEEELSELVDRRYIEHFKEMVASYGNYTAKDTEVKAEVSEIYMFGNNAFVKVLFAGKNVTSKVKSMHEEWTFSRNALAEGPAWQLTNIDRPQ